MEEFGKLKHEIIISFYPNLIQILSRILATF